MTGPAPQTPFVETEALLAVGLDDEDRAEEILGGMSDGELRNLTTTSLRLANIAAGVLADRTQGTRT